MAQLRATLLILVICSPLAGCGFGLSLVGQEIISLDVREEGEVTGLTIPFP